MADIHGDVGIVRVTQGGVIVPIDWTIISAFHEGVDPYTGIYHPPEPKEHVDLTVLAAGAAVTNAEIAAAVKSDANRMIYKYALQRWHGATDAKPSWDSQYSVPPTDYANDQWSVSTVSMSLTVAQPMPAELTFTMGRPVVTNGKIKWCSPTAAALAFAMGTPTVLTPVTCSPRAAELSFSMGTPQVDIWPTPRPLPAALAFSMGTPIVTAS